MKHTQRACGFGVLLACVALQAAERPNATINGKGFEDRISLPDALQNAGFGGPVTVDTEWMGVSGHHLWFTKKS